MGPHVSISEIVKRLEKELRPAYEKATDIAAEMAAGHLRKNLDKPYVDPESGKAQASKSSKAIKGRRPNVTKWEKAKEYPRKRTGSLQASVSTTKAVFRKNVYTAIFGVLKDKLMGSLKTRHKKYKTLFKAHEEKTQNYLRYGGRPNTSKSPKEPHKPTLYAVFLAKGTGKMSPRKLTREAWDSIKYSGELRKRIKQELSGAGSRIVTGGRLPQAKFYTN